MNTTITLRELNYSSITDLEPLVRWHNDLAIINRICRFPTRKSCENILSVVNLEQEGPMLFMGNQKKLVVVNNEGIGHRTLELDSQKRMTTKPNTGGISLAIGNRSYLRQKIGIRVVKRLENLARAAGAKRAGVAIFEQDTGSQKLFTSLGYVDFSRQQNYSWWDGRC